MTKRKEKKKIRIWIRLLIALIVILTIYTIFAMYLTNYMNNYPLYITNQNKTIGLGTSNAGNVISADIYGSDPEIEDSEKIAIIYLIEQYTTYTKNSEVYVMRYIKFKSAKAAKKYLAQFEEEEGVCRYVSGKYFFEEPTIKKVTKDENGEEHEYRGRITPVGGKLFGSPGMMRTCYELFVLFHVD